MVLMNLFVGQHWRHRHREQTYGHRERGGESEKYGGNNMETYIIICKIDSQWEFSIWPRELKQGLCINVSQKTTKFYKAIILQLKKKQINVKISTKKKKCWRGCGEKETLTLPVGIYIDTASMEDSMEIL